MKKGHNKKKDEKKPTGLSTNWKIVCVVVGLAIGLLITGIDIMPSREFRKAVESLPEVQGFLVMYPDAALSGRERVAGNLWKVEGTDGIHNVTVFLDENNQPAYILETWKCGNTVCDSGENCETCEIDCGCSATERCEDYRCRTYCGNGVCELNENCDICSEDCGCSPGEQCVRGVCKTFCGNGICDPQEDCDTCEADCGCSSDERCIYGECKTYCGNGVCEANENRESCNEDCCSAASDTIVKEASSYVESLDADDADLKALFSEFERQSSADGELDVLERWTDKCRDEVYPHEDEVAIFTENMRNDFGECLSPQDVRALELLDGMATVLGDRCVELGNGMLQSVKLSYQIEALR